MDTKRLVWAFVALVGVGWGYHEHEINSVLREQNGLLRELGSTQLRWYVGVEQANYRCAGLLRGVLTRLGLDPEVESVVTTAVLDRYGVMLDPDTVVYHQDDQPEYAGRGGP